MHRIQVEQDGEGEGVPAGHGQEGQVSDVRLFQAEAEEVQITQLYQPGKRGGGQK